MFNCFFTNRLAAGASSPDSFMSLSSSPPPEQSSNVSSQKSDTKPIPSSRSLSLSWIPRNWSRESSLSKPPSHEPSSISSNSSSHTLTSKQSYKTIENVFVAALLPVAGMVGQQAAGGRSLSTNEGEDEPKGLIEEGITIKEGFKQKQTNIIEPELDEIPRCRATPVTFDDICVDVKVLKGDEWLNFNALDTMLTLVGFGGGGEMVDKRILHNLDGVFEPGRLVALMGASGAGKSTLLNVLSRRVIPSNGIVRYGDVPITDTIVQSCSAYVQQLDLFINNLSVHEHLQCQVRLRLPEMRIREERDQREETVCNHLSLAKCRHSQIGTQSGIGGISGGERKRLNVASELLTAPAVLFADEPTTGLDSFMAESIIKAMRKLANSGRTVIVTIHQPSAKIFDMFDEVLLLAEGRLIYFGESVGAIEWFKCLDLNCPPFTNPADFIVKVLSMPEAPDAREKKLNEIIAWSEKWKNEGFQFLKNWRSKGKKIFFSRSKCFIQSAVRLSTQRHSYASSGQLSGILNPAEGTTKNEGAKEEPNKKKINEFFKNGEDAISLILKKRPTLSWFSQVGILYRRALNANRRDQIVFYSQLLQTIILAGIFGSVSPRLSSSTDDARSKIGASWNLVMNQSMVMAFNVIDTFIVDKPIIRREYESGLISPTAYITAKMLADAPIQIIFPTLFATIGWWMMGVNDDFVRFLIGIGIVLLVSNTATSVGYFASAVAPNADIAYVSVVLGAYPLVVFGGLLVKLDDTPKWISWIQYISCVKYGFSNMLVTVFRGQTLYSSTNVPLDGLKVVDNLLGINDSHYGLWFVMLVVLFIVHRLIALIAFPLSFRFTKEND